jgi:hypothetical protein
MNDISQGSPGPSTDRHNDPVVDPTANVRELVEAAIQRQDDLRESDSRHVREIVALRAEYDEQLRKAETARIDAIRAVDVGAVNRAAEVAATQATTLAGQVAISAETLRAQVAAAASAATVALAAALEPVQKDIADLRRAQYEAQGQKTQVVETQNRGTSIGMWIGVALTVAVVMVGVLGIVATIVIAIATHGFTK